MKKISLIFFLTIITKPIFTKIAFPLCFIRNDGFDKIKSTSVCDSFGKHILNPFHHFESYLILASIFTYLMWYFGYINFNDLRLNNTIKNLRVKLNSIIKSLQVKLNSIIKSLQVKFGRFNIFGLIKKTSFETKEKLPEYKSKGISKSTENFYKVWLIFLFIILLWDLIGFGFTGGGFIIFIVFTLLSFFLAFFIQLFSPKWTTVGTAKNWIILWCVSACINILIILKFKFA